jgi:hypothetical protein
LIPLAGCVDGIDPAWQLDHDRVVAARATPPALPAGATAILDALVAHKGAPTSIMAPLGAQLAPGAPAVLANAIAFDSGTWTVTAPDEATLDVARGQLGIDPGLPVPLAIGMAFSSSTDVPLVATKTVLLGAPGSNPVMPPVSVDNGTPGEMIVVAPNVDVPLSVVVADDWTVNWLTSCGTMHDDDEHSAFLHVNQKDPQQGEIAIVIRDPVGGVAWQVWPISAH